MGKHFLLFIFLFAACTSCFNRFILTDSEIEEHYSNKTAKPTFQSLAVGDKTLHYAEIGSDTLPWIIFIHGAPGAWYGYIDYMDDPALYTNYHLISVDRLGYGKSSYGKAVTSIEEQAKAIEKILSLNKSKQEVYVVARSYGCPIAVSLAAKSNDKVNGLLLLAPAVDPELEKFWWFSKPVKSVFVRWMLPKSINVASFEKFAHVNELKTILNDWKKVTQKVIVFQGKQDQIISPLNANFAYEKLINADKKLVFIDSCDHFISSKKPNLVKQAIKELATSKK